MILVTGGAGFIGSNIVAALNEHGHRDIAICDWLGSEGKWRNLRNQMFTYFLRPEELTGWLERAPPLEAVIHMGAISSTTAVDGDEVMRNNFILSTALLDHCTRQNVPFLYASSASVYGDGEQGFDDSNDVAAMRALKPLNLYGWSKRQFDLVVADRMARGTVPDRCVGLRFFNVFGPNEYHKGDMASLVAKITPAIRRGERISLFRSHREGIADGDQRRDFICVSDVVSVVLWAMAPTGRSGIFNVGTGLARSFRELADAVFDTLYMPRLIDYIDMPESIRDKYQYFTEASVSQLRQAGYSQPFTKLEDAISDYVHGFLIKEDPYR